MTPAVKLEAGTTYTFAIDAYAASASYPERLEVKISTEAKASTLAEGITVIEPTDIDFDAAQTLTAEVTVEETGYYHFGIHAISDADNYRLFVDNISIDLAADTSSPAAVTDLSVVQSGEKLAGIVTFTAPTTTVGGEPLTANLTKVELYRDGKLIATFEDVAPGAVLTYTDEADDLTIGTHSYYVLAYNEAGMGKKSNDVKVYLSEILTVPYYADLSSSEEFANFQVIDANDDGRTWEWSQANGTFYRYSGMNDGDDYLVTMPVALQAGKNYSIVVSAAAYSANYPERFEVVLGLEPTPEAMTITAIAPTDLVTNEFEEFEGMVSIKQSGNYYVAIHAISDADKYYMLVNSLAIELGAEGTAPRAVTDLTVEPASQGFMAANVSFVAPTLNVNGQRLSGTMTIEVVRNGKVIATMENVAPGTPVQFLDELEGEQPGLFTYQVFVYNNSGKGLKSEKVTEYIGTDQPLAPTNLAAEDKGIEGVLVTWDKVGSVGQNGGYVDVSKVKYSVYDAWFEDFHGLITYPVVGDHLYGSGYDINSIMARLDPDQGEQDYTYFAVTTANEYTPEGNEDYNLTGLLTGRPYDLPLFEGFANNQLHYFWESNANLYISNDATDGDGVALKLCTDEPGLVYFESGKLNLANTVNPTLFFDVKSNTLPLVTVRAKIDGQPASFIDNAGLNPEFKTVKVPLTALKESRYAQVSIEAQMNKALEIGVDDEGKQQIVAGDSLIIDNIMIVDLKQNDMAVALTTPQTVTAGKSAQTLITVTNQGEVPAKNYLVSLYKGSNVIFQQTVSEELGFYQSKTFTVNIDTDVFTPADKMNLTVYVIYGADEDLSNNRAQGAITVVAPTDATPADLAAEQGEGTTVNVSWTAPAVTVAEATEQFDDQATFAEFSIAGITADQNSGMLGDWTVYDGNSLSVYGFEGLNVPNLGGPMGWMVFTPGSEQLTSDLSQSYAPHSGTQFMASFCVAESATSASSVDPTDHWLISPALPGTAQTIKFFARALTTSYGAETFEVMVSTSDTDIASFTKVGDGTCVETEWTEFSFNLPEGATYFAIRHTSQDVFALFVDDITFTTGGAAPASYNVYVDGQLVTSATDTSAQLTLTPGNHQVSVTAVYANGNESAPVNYWINVADPDAIEQILATGKKVDVYSVDGRLLRQQVSTLKDLTPGVYVIEDRKVIVK